MKGQRPNLVLNLLLMHTTVLDIEIVKEGTHRSTSSLLTPLSLHMAHSKLNLITDPTPGPRDPV